MPTKKRDRKSGAIESKRIPIQREIDVSFPHFQGFVTKVSSNLSMTGLFVQSSDPQDVGSECFFKFRIEDWKLIQGTAEVIWRRETDEGPDRPAGMGLRFIELDAQSRRMVRWLVEKHLHEGGKPFELVPGEGAGAAMPPPPAPAPAARREPAAGPYSRAAAGQARAFSARRTDARRRRILWATLTVLALVMTALASALILAGREDRANLARELDAVANGAVAAEPTAGDGPGEAAVAESASAGQGPTEEERISETVLGWANAWSEQRPAEYLSFYSASFRPADGQPRSEWEQTRRNRLTTPEFIRVTLSGIETEIESGERAAVTFFQSYRSDRFNDTVRKRLDLVREADAWKILAEEVVS